jgi:hypothetical protein
VSAGVVGRITLLPAGSAVRAEAAIPGLPGPLPAGEEILWQGKPSWTALAVRVFHVRKVALYFALLAAWRVAAGASDGEEISSALAFALPLVPVAAVAIGLLALLARLAARSATYTITTRRVVMQVGIALSVTFNIPFRIIGGAGLKVRRDGTGDIPLALKEGRIGYVHLWPHVRPWRLSAPEPMLRAVPDAAKVAAILAGAYLAARDAAAQPADEPSTATDPVAVAA